MERQVIHKLIRWKSKPNRKPLIITGVRQCGKTYIIKKFAEKNFDNTAYFNFDGNDALKSVFDYDLDPSRIIDDLNVVSDANKIIPGKTLLVFDEIQACPRAIQSLKYFSENWPKLHVIAAGSLLGVALKVHGVSFPVGKVDRLQMYPMTFKEFVIADSGEKYLNGIQKRNPEDTIPEIYTIPLQKYLKNYYIVGGMPEAVSAWVKNHSYSEVEEIHDRLLQDYSDDFSKYTSSNLSTKIRMIWDAIPSQIARDNNKFIFSHVKSGARAKDLEDALNWIVNAGLAHKVNLVPNPEVPLSGMADYTYFKVYMSDVGLLRRKSKINYKTLLHSNDSFVHFKGALTENYVLQELIAQGIDPYFWRANATAEVDFITDHDGKITPIEVKAADNTKAKSLQVFVKRYVPELAIKTSLKNIGTNKSGNTTLWSIPLYMLFRLNEYIERK